MIAKLHFVYNVDATPQAVIKDFVHREMDPETYPCRLCDLTYGRFVKKPGWKKFLASLPVPSDFHMRNVFVRKYPSLKDQPWPAVLAENEDGSFQVLISSEDFVLIATLDALEAVVRERLEKASNA